MGEGEGSEFPPKKAGQSENQSSDFPTKKLARQLDFTVGNVNVTLSDHPQSQPPVTVPVVQRPIVPPSQPQPPVMAVSAVAPLVQQHPQSRALKLESPKSKPISSSEPKDGTPKRPKQCNCKHSRCLKLYCECFASGTYCDGCNCANCYNNVDHEAARREAVEATLERNPNAFRPKIANSPRGPRDNREENKEGTVLPKHNKGCHCKKSGCLKKYCECFQAGILCSGNCKCMDCKNFEGSDERQALYHGHHTNDIAHIQQAANAAITGAIGSSGYTSPPVSKRRKGQELLFGPTIKDPSFQRVGQFPQAVHMRPSGPSSSLSSNHTARAVNTAATGPSKFTYRSLLADIIQPQDLKELCSVLVVLSTEAAKTVADQRTTTDKNSGHTETLLTSETHERLHSQNEARAGADNATATGSSSANSADKAGPDDATSSKERPMSPGTLELMCDEKDTIFTAPASPGRLTGEGHSNTSQLPLRQGITEVYAEQERIVLTKFRDCLNRLITFGEIKETKCSSLVRTELGNQKEAIANGTLNHVISPTSKPSPMAASAVVQSSTELPKNPPVPQNGDNKPKS